MKKIFFLIIIFISIKNYSQEILFVKEYDRFSYRDTDDDNIDRILKSYVYFYDKGKVKVKVESGLILTFFFTESKESIISGIKHIFFKGIDNRENSIRGFYTDEGFSILSESSTIILEKEKK